MRVYVPVGVAELEKLAADQPIAVEGYLADSTDEEDELAAVEAAADEAAAVAVAEVDDPDAPISLAEVEAFHIAVDQTGDLAWFAPSELAAVLDLARAATSG